MSKRAINIFTQMEDCLILGEKLKVPIILCENAQFFRSVFAIDSWNMLTEEQRNYLKTLLPIFEEDDTNEKNLTIQMLFSNQEFRFEGNPLTHFQCKLHNGFYKVDIAKKNKCVMKARYHAYRRKQRLYYFDALKLSLISSQLLGCNGDFQHKSRSSNIINRSFKRRSGIHISQNRSKCRYNEELESIKLDMNECNDSSGDHNY